jgi:hypothetical protein
MTTAAVQCLHHARARMPSFIAAVLDRGSRQLAFRSVLMTDIQRSAATREAGAMLFKLRQALGRAFLEHVEEALAGEAGDRDVTPAAAMLDICLDEGLDERLDVAHLCDAAELGCTAERVEFEALFSGASGSHVVRGVNPLGPEVLARCLASALREWPVRQVVRDAWFTYLGEPLGIELALLYRALSRSLRQSGVPEAEFIPPMAGGRRFESWRAA